MFFWFILVCVVLVYNVIKCLKGIDIVLGECMDDSGNYLLFLFLLFGINIKLWFCCIFINVLGVLLVYIFVLGNVCLNKVIKVVR